MARTYEECEKEFLRMREVTVLSDGAAKKCTFCKKTGHQVYQNGTLTCMKLKQTKCKLCGLHGHTPKFCGFPKKSFNKEKTTEVNCKICDEKMNVDDARFNCICYTCSLYQDIDDFEEDAYEDEEHKEGMYEEEEQEEDEELYQCLRCGDYSNGDSAIGLCGGCRK